MDEIASQNINRTAQEQIDTIAKKCSRIKPVVAISCITFNHEPFIREALEGFLMQRTDFPFVAIVHDDASTDHTADIVREYAEKYPDIILPIFEEENQYSKRNGTVGRIMSAARAVSGAKYIAFCEGDDYWIDPLKLQKQVDFLESHPDYGLVCSYYQQYNQKDQRFYGNDQHYAPQEITFNDLILHNSIATLTVLLRAEVLRGYGEFIREAPTLSFGDYPLWLFVSTKGKIMRLAEGMSVYRVLENSASHMTNDEARLKWVYSEFSMFDYFNSRFEISKLVQRKAMFKRCDSFERLALSLKDTCLINRIRGFYKEQFFPIAWLSFNLKTNYPKASLIYNFIDSHHSIKAPLFYIKTKLDKHLF